MRVRSEATAPQMDTNGRGTRVCACVNVCVCVCACVCVSARVSVCKMEVTFKFDRQKNEGRDKLRDG